MPDFARIYAKQEYMTPGAEETVRIIAETVRPTESTVLLDIGTGKGEAAATLAGEFSCQVIAVEPFDSFVHIAAAKFWFFNLRDLVTLLRADGRRLPLRDAVFDAAYCIGAPSIVGLEAAFREMARAVKPGAWVVASDIIWREKPGLLGEEWGWVAAAAQTTEDEYRAVIEGTGLALERVEVHGRSVWDEYHRGMLEVAQEAKTSQPTDIFFADEVESGVELERRAAERWLDYATFVARKPKSRSLNFGLSRTKSLRTARYTFVVKGTPIPAKRGCRNFCSRTAG
jgi:SAM-dependent methyltransferase